MASRSWKVSGFLLTAALVAVLFACFWMAQPATAANPTTMSFQGKVVNSNGTNVTDGTYTFVFKLYTLSSGGSALWTETQSSVTVTAGVFQVNLGSVCPFFTANACNSSTPIDFNANPNLYLGITFNSDPAGEMNPRVQLQSVPFAFNADRVGGLSVSQLVQLSPAVQQSGFINVTGNATFGGMLNVQGTGNSTISGNLLAGSATSKVFIGDVGGSGVGYSAGFAATAANANLTNYALLQKDDGTQTLLNAAAGGALLLRINNTNVLTVQTGVVGIIGGLGVTSDISGGNRINLPATSGTAGQGYFIRNSTPTNIASFQALDLAGSTYSFLANNKYYNGSAWVDSGLGRVGSSFQIQNDNFTFYSFDTGVNFVARFTVASGGNVGVGIAGPNYKLDVQGGDINASGSLRTAGTSRVDSSGNLVSIGNITGTGAIVLQPAGGAALTITGHAASTFGTDAGTLTLQGGSGTVSLGTSTILTASGALAVSAGGAAQNLTLNASTTGLVQIGGSSTGNIELGGGSASTGCTVTNSTGALACSNALTISAGGAAITGNSTIAGTLDSITTLTAGTINATTAYQSNGIPGSTIAACSSGQYIGNGVRVSDGLITAGTCRSDATGLSDARLKQNVTPIQGALDSLGQLRPVSFQFNDLYHEVTDDALDYGTQYGFIAQEVQQVMPGLVSAELYGTEGYYGIDYHAFFGLLTSAIQELNLKVESLSGQSNGNLSVAGTITAEAVEAQTGTFADHIVSSRLLADGALDITSGMSGDVALDSGGNSALVNIGTANATAVNIASAGAATNIRGALVAEGPTQFTGEVTMRFSEPQTTFTIDNSGSTSAIDAAIQITDSSGSGYGKLISTSNFSVTGNGDVTTNGSLISKGGSFQLLDTAGQQLISFDQSGSANFKGNLNLASASLSGGLSVGGDANFAGLSTFQKLATFLGKTIFRQDVQFEGHVTVAKDTAGYAMLRAGESTVHVTFTVPYNAQPVVTATLTDGQFALTSIKNVTTLGFDIQLHEAASQETKLSWTAFGVTDPQTVSNPLPASP